MSHPAAYYDGKGQRKNNNEKSANPFTRMTSSWSWWMAGWNDADIELEASRAGRISSFTDA